MGAAFSLLLLPGGAVVASVVWDANRCSSNVLWGALGIGNILYTIWYIGQRAKRKGPIQVTHVFQSLQQWRGYVWPSLSESEYQYRVILVNLSQSFTHTGPRSRHWRRPQGLLHL